MLVITSNFNSLLAIYSHDKMIIWKKYASLGAMDLILENAVRYAEALLILLLSPFKNN